MKRYIHAQLTKRKARKAKRQQKRMYQHHVLTPSQRRESMIHRTCALGAHYRPYFADPIDFRIDGAQLRLPDSIIKARRQGGKLVQKLQAFRTLIYIDMSEHIPDAFVSSIFIAMPVALRGMAAECFEVYPSSIGDAGRRKTTTFYSLRKTHHALTMLTLEKARKQGVELPAELTAIMDEFTRIKPARRVSELSRYYRKVARFFDTSLPKRPF